MRDLKQVADTVLSYDQTHIAKGYLQYQLPVGRGRRYLGSAPGWVNALLGGWDLTWIYRYNTGNPLGISPNVSYPGWDGAVYADWNQSANLSRKFDTGSFNPGLQNDPTNLYFDRSAFSNPTNHKLGNGRRRYDALRGFGSSNEDLGLLKYWHFKERASLQFRAEVLNLFNRHHYSDPNTGLGQPDELRLRHGHDRPAAEYPTRVAARMVKLAIGLLLLARCGAGASPAPFSPDRMETILYGAAYYPEYMPTDRLEKDVALMEKAGINLVRVGESTWSSWEPRDGHFEFAWMERALDRLHRAGIKVILGTPTYSIPTWLYRAHPEIAVTHNGTAPPLSDPYSPSYPPSLTPGYYGPRQNYDFLNPHFRRHAERVIRQIVGHFKDHPAVIGYQIDNETFPNGVPTPYTTAAFLERLKRKYETPAAINRLWGLAYWGQLVDTWEDLPPRNGILNPGYKLEWENFQHDIVTEYLAWQAKIVNEYKRPGQFITHDFSGGAHTNLDQWAIARNIDVVAENPYFETQDRLNARGYLVHRRRGALAQAHELPGDGDQRADHRVGLARAVSSVPGSDAAGGVHAPRRGREHGGLLALALPALRAGDVLEGCALA